MQETLTSVFGILEAVFSGQSWEISQAVRDPALYWLVAVAILPISTLLMIVFRKVPPLDRYLEPTAMFFIYLTIAMIIFV